MKNTADVTGKPITVLLQSISLVSAINPLVTFYDIHGGKREVLFFYFVPETTRVLLGNRTRDLLRSRRVSHDYAKSAVNCGARLLKIL
jgi:hypothetical protein